MSLPGLPLAIAAFLRAANARDATALLETFADGAVLTDMGQTFRDEGLHRWSDNLFSAPRMAVHPIEASERQGETVVSVVIHGVKPDARAQVRRDWRFRIDGTRIAALDMVEASEPDLPPSVAAFVQSTNACDLQGLMAVFSDDAMVNDDFRERWGKAAIRQWAEHEFLGQNVRVFVVQCVRHHWIAIVTAHVDGDFDRRGLPYPLVLTFYFSIDTGKIIQLIILRNQPD